MNTHECIKKALLVAIESSTFGNENESPEFSPLSKSTLKEIEHLI